MERGDHAFQTGSTRAVFDDEPKLPVRRLYTEVEEKGQQPVAGQRIVILRSDVLEAGGIVRAGSEEQASLIEAAEDLIDLAIERDGSPEG